MVFRHVIAGSHTEWPFGIISVAHNRSMVSRHCSHGSQKTNGLSTFFQWLTMAVWSLDIIHMVRTLSMVFRQHGIGSQGGDGLSTHTFWLAPYLRPFGSMNSAHIYWLATRRVSLAIMIPKEVIVVK